MVTPSPLTQLFQNQSPSWFKKPLQGPAKGEKGRQVGCNGMVCYCNNADYCNQKEGQEVTMGNSGGLTAKNFRPLLLLLPALTLVHFML